MRITAWIIHIERETKNRWKQPSNYWIKFGNVKSIFYLSRQRTTHNQNIKWNFNSQFVVIIIIKRTYLNQKHVDIKFTLLFSIFSKVWETKEEIERKTKSSKIVHLTKGQLYREYYALAYLNLERQMMKNKYKIPLLVLQPSGCTQYNTLYSKPSRRPYFITKKKTLNATFFLCLKITNNVPWILTKIILLSSSLFTSMMICDDVDCVCIPYLHHTLTMHLLYWKKKFTTLIISFPISSYTGTMDWCMRLKKHKNEEKRKKKTFGHNENGKLPLRACNWNWKIMKKKNKKRKRDDLNIPHIKHTHTQNSNLLNIFSFKCPFISIQLFEFKNKVETYRN